MSFQQRSSPGSNNHRRKCCLFRTNKLSHIAVVLSLICLLSMTSAEELYVQRYRHKRAQPASANANVNTNTNTNTNTNDDDFIDDGRHDQDGVENNKDNLSNQPTPGPSVTPSSLPSSNPSALPTALPSVNPTTAPSNTPSVTPTNMPSSVPSLRPSGRPTSAPTSLPSLQPSDPPSGLPTVVPTMLPSLYPSKSPSEVPTVPPSTVPTLLPSGKPSIDCELGSAYGDERGTPLELVFQYEITFDNTKPASDYIERVILPYLREVFAESFLTSVSSITPYCDDECLLRRSRLRAEDLPITRRLQDVLAEADRKRTTTGNKRVHQTVTNNTFLETNDNNSTLNEVEGDQLNADSNTNDGFDGSVINTVGNNDQVVNGLIGIGLDSTNDEIDFFPENCTTTNSASCVRINGNLLVYLDTPPDNVNLVENQLLQRLRQAMNNDLYVCSDPLLDIETVSYVEPDNTILAIQQTDDAIELTPTASSNFMAYSFIGGGVALGLLGMLLMFVRKKQTSEAFIDDIDDLSVYGNATPSAISENNAWLTPI